MNNYSLIDMNKILDSFSKNYGKEYFKTYFSTGFSNLDQLLHGGITSGLTILGAEPSIGKSSLLWQIAENFAKEGHKVLYFSLEMSPANLAAKLISRKMYEISHNSHISKSSDDILCEKFVNEFNEETKELYHTAIENTLAFNSNIKVISPNFLGYTITDVTSIIESNKDNNIIVIIDYLQLLSSSDKAAALSDKAKTDYKIRTLKYTANAFNIPIIAISSINRISYSKPISLDSFKESGDIEFNADTILGMQYKHISEKSFNPVLEKSKSKIDISLSILKQRYGICSSVNYSYYPKFSYFKENIER